jgi:long-subunit fatty acid transport protein
MRKYLAGVAMLPFMLGVASAGQPLTALQMDKVTAGYSATSLAGATGLAGESGVVFTATTTIAQVNPVVTSAGLITVDCNCGTSAPVTTEGTSTLFASQALSSSTTVTGTYSVTPITGALVIPTCGC